MISSPYSQRRYNERGYVTLLSVLIVGAVGVSVTLSLLILGIQSSQATFAFEQSASARSFADACAEEALQEVRDGTSSGSGSLSFSEGGCTYTITSAGGQNRTIEADGTVDSIVRKVRVQIDQVNPTINVASWQEVADL